MTDIYLSCNESNFEVAKILKQDVEACSNLSIAFLENDNWEEEAEFMEALPQAKLFIIITTATSNITAWIIGRRNIHKMRQPGSKITKPPTVDFSYSHEDGMETLTYVLKLVTGFSRFHKSRPKMQAGPAKEIQEARGLEQQISEAERKRRSNDQDFTMAKTLILPAGSNRPRRQSQEKEPDLLVFKSNAATLQ